MYIFLLQPLRCLMLFMEKDNVYVLFINFKQFWVNVLDFAFLRSA